MELAGGNAIKGIFVCVFDTKRGNVIEYQKPNALELNMDGVEFSSLPSGSHNVRKDFCLFYVSHLNLYGICAYGKIETFNSEERGSRIKSVGLLFSKRPQLLACKHHINFLSKQLKNALDLSYALTPNVDLNQYYNHLHIYFIDNFSCTTGRENSSNDLIGQEYGQLEQMVDAIGPNLFTLWKLILLNKRVLLYTTVPMGLLCQYLILLHSIVDTPKGTAVSRFLYHVTLNDMGLLKRKLSFIAVTSEKAYEFHPDTYDVLYCINFNGEQAKVQKSPIQTHTCRNMSTNKMLTQSNRADFQRFHRFRTQHNTSLLDLLDCLQRFHLNFMRHFADVDGITDGYEGDLDVELNDENVGLLFNSTETVSIGISYTSLSDLGLDPIFDALFVKLLCRQHNIDSYTQGILRLMDCCLYKNA